MGGFVIFELCGNFKNWLRVKKKKKSFADFRLFEFDTYIFTIIKQM